MRKCIETLLLAVVLALFSVAFGSIGHTIYMADLGHGANAVAILMAAACGLMAYSAVLMPVLYWRHK